MDSVVVAARGVSVNGGGPASTQPDAELSRRVYQILEHASQSSLDVKQDDLLAEAQPVEVDVRFGVHCQKGARPTMEDEHLCVLDVAEGSGRSFEEAGARAFFGVFDGHGGRSAANFAKVHLLERLLADAHFPVRIPEALRAAFVGVDEAFYAAVHAREGALRDAGATALAALVWGRALYVANAGDSRAVLSRHGRALELSTDHKPSCPAELQRIAAAGGYICNEGFLNGQLTVTRAIGDFNTEDFKFLAPRDRLKHATGAPERPHLSGPLTSEPEVRAHELAEDDEFLVVACDGLWDVLTSQRCVELARHHLREHNDAAACAKFLVDTSLEMHSSDNVTVVVVCFGPDPPPRRDYAGAASHASAGCARSLSRDSLSTLATALSLSQDTRCATLGTL